MSEIEQKIFEWRKQNKQTAIATLVKVYGSAPQPLGAKMGISEDLEFIGSVSGGCVEGDVIEQAAEVMQSNKPRLLTYGISDDTAWTLGLSCGGTIEVFVEPVNELDEQIVQLHQSGKLFAVLTMLDGKNIGEKQIVLPDELCRNDRLFMLKSTQIYDAVQHALQNQKSEKINFKFGEENCQVFCEVYSPPARLLIIGAVHIAIPLVEFAHLLGFYTIVIDARSSFANRDRFPSAHQLIVGWPADEIVKLKPDENTFFAFVSHDEKFDLPAIHQALQSKSRYIGVLGSRITHAGRVEKLLEMGIPSDSISRLYAPIGLDIGAHGAEEIALSIISQMIAIRNGKNLPGKA